MQKQPKKVTVDGVELVAQYGSYTFMAKRFQGVNKLFARRRSGIVGGWRIGFL
jgi:hypothetical protein